MPASGTAETDTRPGRPRDAAKTRQLLLEAARRRFARDGYAAATVRDIADEVGVNVALINRYFASKEGLFEACLSTAVDELERAGGQVGLGGAAEAIARHAVGSAEGGPNWVLLMLLRSSGDERAEKMRLGVLRRFSEQLASVSDHRDRSGDELLLRAQIVLSAAFGIALLRGSGLQPLASADEPAVLSAAHDLVHGLLSQPGPTTART